jgi:RES domain-containing protein
MKPIHPGRWMPVGNRAQYLALNEECSLCRDSKECACINAITVEDVKHKIDSYSEAKFNGVLVPAYFKV